LYEKNVTKYILEPKVSDKLLDDDNNVVGTFVPQETIDCGTYISSLNITEIDVPDELRTALAARVLAQKTADAEVAVEAARAKISKIHAVAAANYAGNEDAQRLLSAKVLSEIARSDNKTIILGTGDVLDSLDSLLGKKKGK